MRILVIITGSQYIRNYIQSKAFGALEARHSVSYIAVPGHLFEPPQTSMEQLPSFAGYYRYPSSRSARWTVLLNVLMARYSFKSKTFGFRLKRFSRWGRLKCKILGLPIVAEAYRGFALKKLGYDAELRTMIKKLKPDLVLMPASAFDPMCEEVALLGKMDGFKTLQLIDNWDNLSSKTIMVNKPDHLAVWGEQSREHAVSIQGLLPDRVSLLGTPRFEDYFATRYRALRHPSPLPFPYILFAGCAQTFNEIEALHLIDGILAKEKSGTSIVYRPHPWPYHRKCSDALRARDFRNVRMDPQMADFYALPASEGSAKWPALDYYPALLQNALFVVCPLSTMIIEAAILGKPVLIIAYHDGIHYASPANSLKYYRHFEGIEKIPGFVIVKTREEYKKQFQRFVNNPPPGPSLEEIKYFIYHSEEPYPERLCSIIDQIAKAGGTK